MAPKKATEKLKSNAKPPLTKPGAKKTLKGSTKVEGSKLMIVV